MMTSGKVLYTLVKFHFQRQPVSFPNPQLHLQRATTYPPCAWLRYFCTVGTATVMHADLRVHPERELSALAWLDAEERARWQNCLHLGARRRFALCRAALRLILCQQLACPNAQLAFGRSRYGKPFATVSAAPAAVSFNVSHSGEHGLIAFAPAGRLGIDVEEYVARRYPDHLSTSSSLFTAQERGALARAQGSDKVHLFARLWTLKEALAKAHGTGLRRGSAQLAIPAALLHGTTSRGQFASESAVQWRADYIGGAAFAAAVVQEIF